MVKSQQNSTEIIILIKTGTVIISVNLEFIVFKSLQNFKL